MKIPDIKECVSRDKIVRFVRCESGNLTYVCENGFEFEIPYSDTHGATFLAEDKSTLFMRWIRKEIERRQRWLEEAPTDVP